MSVNIEIAALEADAAALTEAGRAQPSLANGLALWRNVRALDLESEEPLGLRFHMLAQIGLRDGEALRHIWAPSRTAAEIGDYIDRQERAARDMAPVSDADLAMMIAGLQGRDNDSPLDRELAKDFCAAGGQRRAGLCAVMERMISHGFAWAGSLSEARLLFSLLTRAALQAGSGPPMGLPMGRVPGAFLDRNWHLERSAEAREQDILLWLPFMKQEAQFVRESLRIFGRQLQATRAALKRDRRGRASALLEHLCLRPFMTSVEASRYLREAGKPETPMADIRNLLLRLAATGIIEEHGNSRYNRCFVARRYLDLLEMERF